MKSRKRPIVTAALIILVCGSLLPAGWRAPAFALTEENRSADDSGKDETGKTPSYESMFGDDAIVKPSEEIQDDSLSEEFERKSVSFTGFLNSRTSVDYQRRSILRKIDVIKDGDFLSYLQGNFILDARFVKGIKGYVNFYADYYPAGIPKSRNFQVPLVYLGIPAYFTSTDLAVSETVNAAYGINEIFLDLNIARAVYFRIGKQTLKWGTGYLWTPNDLINIEKINIIDSSQVRQGSYGLKIHVPFGTRANLYSFVNMNRAKNLTDMSLAAKAELLVKNTEMAISILLKKKNVPVYGFDITTRIIGLDIHGEASVSYGDNSRRQRVYPWLLIGAVSPFPMEYLMLSSGANSSILDYRVKGKWIPRASFGFGRGFEVKDVKDRIRVDLEAFYNHAGYERHMFEKDIITVSNFLSRGLYEPNYFGKYYAGMFITIRQIFVEELSLMINGIVNIR
ncbi:MAG: hypothetical protein E4G96_00720 [Chrysiogenales bacterium]|nr:MAG: hypothetical protein E4G96_00720 [Chrysiogenales bacterium]